MAEPMDMASDFEDGPIAPFRGTLPCYMDGLAKTDVDLAPLVAPVASSMASSIVTSLLDVSSSPISAGPSRPPMQMNKDTGFVPPTRPSSTPFPHLETRNPSFCCLDDSDDVSDADLSLESSTTAIDQSVDGHSPGTRFDELPTEVHEAILDHIFGYCVSPTSSSAMRMSSLTHSWGIALRHSRRKELTQLARLNHTWRILIQQRLYRHIKLKATIESIENAMVHLAQREHLASYIKHVEIWFPVFQPTYTSQATTNTLSLPTVTTHGLTNTLYTLPANNCTLEEVFRFVQYSLPQIKVLTLEGGERQKAPQVVHFRHQDPDTPRQFTAIDSIKTLVTKGQWNLMRQNADFETILGALPNLEEWQGSYSKPKSKSYITMSTYLPLLPRHVKNLNLCLENDYRREGAVSAFYSKVSRTTHICTSMGEVLPDLEHFTYTGRVCHRFFETALRIADSAASRLKTIDLTVKNCCRNVHNFHDSGSGIQDMSFIEAFEKLVLAGIRSMEKFQRLQYLRIRFVDLDSVLPPLNPFFIFSNNACSGVWSDLLVTEMARVRPEASYTELSETFGDILYSKEGRMVIAPEYPRTRIASLKLSNYRSLARITIQ